MKKIGYLLEETLKFRKEIVLKTDLSEEELINEMDRAERVGETAEDVASMLNSIPGIEVVVFPDNDYSSPVDAEVEYYDHIEIGEEE